MTIRPTLVVGETNRGIGGREGGVTEALVHLSGIEHSGIVVIRNCAILV